MTCVVNAACKFCMDGNRLFTFINAHFKRSKFRKMLSRFLCHLNEPTVNVGTKPFTDELPHDEIISESKTAWPLRPAIEKTDANILSFLLMLHHLSRDRSRVQYGLWLTIPQSRFLQIHATRRPDVPTFAESTPGCIMSWFCRDTCRNSVAIRYKYVDCRE